jgi:hypothetical protein
VEAGFFPTGGGFDPKSSGNPVARNQRCLLVQIKPNLIRFTIQNRFTVGGSAVFRLPAVVRDPAF